MGLGYARVVAQLESVCVHSVFCMHLCCIYSVAGECFHAAEEKDRIVVQAVGDHVQRNRCAGIFTVNAQSFDKVVATIDHKCHSLAVHFII